MANLLEERNRAACLSCDFELMWLQEFEIITETKVRNIGEDEQNDWDLIPNRCGIFLFITLVSRPALVLIQAVSPG
jgi:hypothetical protein